MIDLTSWLTKAEACEKLAISERTLDRLVDRKQVERRSRPAFRRRPVPVHNPDEIERLAAREPVVQVADSPSPVAGRRGLANLSRSPAAAGAMAVLEQIALLAQAVRPRAWMTIEEASEYCGLSKRGLRRMVKDGVLLGLRDGAIKVRKVDIDAYAGTTSTVVVRKAGAVAKKAEG